MKTKITESIFLLFLLTFAEIARLLPTSEFMLMAAKTIFAF